MAVSVARNMEILLSHPNKNRTAYQSRWQDPYFIIHFACEN
jgi:hypothetical protein